MYIQMILLVKEIIEPLIIMRIFIDGAGFLKTLYYLKFVSILVIIYIQFK